MFYIQLLVLQLQIAAAVLLVLLVRLIIRKLPKVYSYLLWLLVFARLLCPVVPESHLGIMPSRTEGTAWVEQVWAEQAMPNKDGGGEVGNFQQAGTVPAQSPQMAGGNGAVWNPSGHPSGGLPHMSDVEAQYPSHGENSSTGDLNPKLMMAGRVFLAVWGLGAAVILGYNGFALLRVRKKLKSAAWFSENVYVCDGIGVPFALGMIHPRIYIPQGLLDKERDYIICHERVHISRKDYLVKNLAFLLTALYWFNPFVWVAFFFLERDMEMSCDERVIRLMGTGIKRQYSQSLLNFAEGKGSLAVTPLTFGENSVRQRVKNVLSYENAKKWSILLGVVILVVSGIALFTTRAERADTAPQEEHEDAALQENRGDAAPQEESFVEDDDIWQTDRWQMDWELIESREAFEQRYGEPGTYDFGYESTGYSTDAYQVILRHLISGTETSIYERYTDPVTAAVEILHLGAGEGQADYGMVPPTVEGWEIPWLEALSMAGEGSRATVTYTFAGDGSTVEIPMELIEGSVGIWGPADCGMSRTVYQTREAISSAQGEETFYIQISRYGIYRLDRSGLRCVYPYYVPSNVVWTEADGKMYFPSDTFYRDGNLDYWEDVICILDLETGEFDKETYPITDTMHKELYPLRWMSVYGGFLQLYGEDGSGSLYLSLINTGKTALSSGNTWNGKAVAELSEEERNAYGLEVRDYLLNHPGQLVELSNRAFAENYIYVDMDGDGRTERVSLSAKPHKERYEYPYDSYVLRSGDSVLEVQYDYMHNSIWAVSLDGEEIVLALYGDGPSGDPMTFLYRYEQGTLREAGSFADDIRQCTIEDGVINGSQRQDVVQTNWVKAQWRMGTNERQEKTLEWVPYDTYDFTMLNDITLTTRLTVHTAPDMASATSVIQPQTVRFVKTDASFTWVCLETESGETGWFATEESGLQIPEAEGKSESREVFENLNFAG